MTGGVASPVVLLGSDGPATRIIYHALAREFPALEVVLERRLSRFAILRRRFRTLGASKAIGQVPFRAIVVPLLALAGANRISEIKREYRLDDSPIPSVAAYVQSVNSAEARDALRRLNPSVIAVSGTRIIGRETLQSVSAPFINMHGGITPLYRGVHGGYWALVDGRQDLVGSTVHRIDEGIDTGAIIAHAKFDVTAADSFATYPYLHTAAGIPPLVDALRQVLNGTSPGTVQPALASRLRTHPTLFEYVTTRVQRGIK
jgi:folate-dependent phosphoribosylglycinamide formyltransferase PurN